VTIEGDLVRRPVPRALIAAEVAVRRNSLRINAPIIGTVDLPAAEDIAFLGGVAVLVAFGVIEWPIAVVLGAGHTLATIRHRKLLHAFGEALEAV